MDKLVEEASKNSDSRVTCVLLGTTVEETDKAVLLLSFAHTRIDDRRSKDSFACFGLATQNIVVGIRDTHRHQECQ